MRDVQVSRNTARKVITSSAPLTPLAMDFRAPASRAAASMPSQALSTTVLTDGVIAEISPQANRQKATVQVKVQILNPDEYLRPEMNATVKFLADEGKRAGSQPSGVFVPTTAVRDQDGRKVVFIAFNGKALMREIHVMSQRSGGLVVQGLNGGEDVITGGPPDLKDGNKIKIKGQS